MSEQNEKPGKIYAALAAITGEIEPIGKTRKNQQQGYAFRGIDDVYAVLQKLLAKHKVVIVPMVSSVADSSHPNQRGTLTWRVSLQMEYRLYAEDGSFVTARIPSEGIDTSDKATNKALSFAFKYLAFQLFCIPLEGVNVDGDAESPEAAAPKPKPEPPKETPEEMAERRATMISALQEKLGSATDAVTEYLWKGLPKPWLKEGQTFGALTDARLKYAVEHAEGLADQALKWKESQ